MSSTFHRHMCAKSSGVVLPALFNYGRGKGVRLRRCRRCLPSSTSSPLGYRCFCCLGSACGSNFCVAEGVESRTPNPPMSSSKSVFFLPVAGPPLLISPVLLEISSLSEPWSVDSLSGATLNVTQMFLFANFS